MSASTPHPTSRRPVVDGLRAQVAIALTDEAMGRIDAVAAACRAAGLEQASTLAEVGVLTGRATLRDLPRLWAIPGVLAIERLRAPPRRRRVLDA